MNDDSAVSQQPTATNPGTAEARVPVADVAAVPCPQCGAASRAEPCPQCEGLPGSATTAWVYAIGRIVPRFPDLGVEKEFMQAGSGGLGGVLETDRLIAILQQEEFRYLARQLCWILHNGESDALVLVCRDDTEAERLVNRMPDAETAERTIQVIVGSTTLGAIDTPCAATGLPAVTIDQHLTFTIDQFIGALAEAQHEGESGREADGGDDDFRAAAKDLFARLTRRSGNRGLSDEHRALNYIALRYPALYRVAADAHRDNKMLVDVLARRTQGKERKLVAVRLLFRGRRTDLLERYQCIVDVTDRFPFLSSSISQIYD